MNNEQLGEILLEKAIKEKEDLNEQFDNALNSYMLLKKEQIERIETQIETVIERQEATLHDLESHPPGIFTLPANRSKYALELEKQHSILERLHERHDRVHQIKEGVVLGVSKIEDLAYNKMRFFEPEAVADWEHMQEAQRRHIAHQVNKSENAKRRVTGHHMELKISSAY